MGSERAPRHGATLTVMRTRVFVPLLMVLLVPLAALSASPAGAANGIALLTDVQAQNMGDFDRVTFTFEDGVPEILQADYFDGPAAELPSGLLVSPPVAGPPRLAITMSNASGFDLSVDPAVPIYTGPKRFSPNLPKMIELMQVQDFEATLTWVLRAPREPRSRPPPASPATRPVWSSTSRTTTRSSPCAPSFTG